MNVAPGDRDALGTDDTGNDLRPGEDDIRDPLDSWGRTGRLAVIRLSEAAAPALALLGWYVARH
jgi:hypothetical protein